MSALLSDLIEPGMLAALGAALLLFPTMHRRRAQQRHAVRLAELDNGAEERFFEERRSLDAYHPPSRDWMWRLIGVAFLALGIFQMIMLLTR